MELARTLKHAEVTMLALDNLTHLTDITDVTTPTSPLTQRLIAANQTVRRLL